MGIVNDFKGANIQRIGEGTYPARIAQVLDLGMQRDEYKGEVKTAQKLWITFELPTERIDVNGESKPRWISREVTKSTGDKAILMKVLKAIFSQEELDEVESFKEMLGKPLLIEVGTTSGGKDKVIGFTKVMKGMSISGLESNPAYLDCENIDNDVYDSLPDFLKEKIDGRIVEEDGDTPF